MPSAIPATTGASAIVAILLAVWSGWGSPTGWELPIFGVALLVSELSVVRFVIGRQGISFSLSDAVIVVAFVLAPGAWIVLWVLFGYFVTNVRRTPSVKLCFNMAALAAAVAGGVAVTVALHGGITAAMAGIAVFTVVNQMLTAVAVSATSGQRYLRVLGAAAGLGAIQSGGNASLGLLTAWLVLHAPLGLVALVAPLVLLWWSYDQQGKRATEARLFEELADGQEQVIGKSVDTSAQVVVTAAARSFGGAEVEMLLRHPDGPIRYVGDEHGIQSRTRVETEAFGSPPVLRAMAARGVLTGIEQDRPYCSALLGDHERPLAVLIARRPERAGLFTREDQRLTEVLVRQAEAWLSVADLTARHDAAVGQVEVYGAASRVLGDIGEGTAPALTVLRESANRLSRLAYAFDGPDPISEIVGELHSVERAVASLLGAIALTSDPRIDGTGRGVDTMQSSGARTDTEWTTTGRLEVAESW